MAPEWKIGESWFDPECGCTWKCIKERRGHESAVFELENSTPGITMQSHMNPPREDHNDVIAQLQAEAEEAKGRIHGTPDQWNEREQRLMREALFRSAVLVRRMVPTTVGNMEAQVEQALAMPLAEQLFHEVRKEEAIEYGAKVVNEDMMRGGGLEARYQREMWAQEEQRRKEMEADLEARRAAMEQQGIAERMRSDAAKHDQIRDLRRRARKAIELINLSPSTRIRDCNGVLRELLAYLPPTDNCGND